MSYTFCGLLSKFEPIPVSAIDGAVGRRLDVAGLKYGAIFSDPPQSNSDILKLAVKLALPSALYIHYQTWAGDVDLVEGFHIRDGALIDNSAFRAEAPYAKKIFIQELRNHGAEISDDGHFQPFARGYWDG